MKFFLSPCVILAFMKRLTIILLCILTALAASVPSHFAYADGAATYARAKVRGAYFFYEKSETSSLFIVPYTYCVEVIAEEGEWYRVKYGENSGLYQSKAGFCRKDDFEILPERPKVTYLYKTVPVTYKSETSAPLPVLGDITIDAAYYGTYYSGATAYSYVLCNGEFGYVLGANDDYPLIEDEAKDAAVTDTDNGNTVNSNLVTALVLCALAAAALILLFVSLKKRGRTDGV